MKLFSWLNDTHALAEATESSESPITPALKARLQELQTINVKDAMVPRALVTALDADVQLRRVRRLKSAKVNYFPVFQGDLDHILGWISKPRVLELLNEAGEEAPRLKDNVRPVGSVTEEASVANLTEVFLKTSSPFLTVKSLQGTTLGIVPLSEFVELLFGFELTPPSPSSGAELSLLRGYEL